MRVNFLFGYSQVFPFLIQTGGGTASARERASGRLIGLSNTIPFRNSVARSFAAGLLILVCLAALFPGCRRGPDELPLTPPATHPLSREYIGYGVINVSFIHLLSEAGPAGISGGYLRRGTVVRILERRLIYSRGNSESWVLAEGNYEAPGGRVRGWIQETAAEIYDNESRALTASKAMNL